MRKVYLLPNLFTTGSLLCGLLAIMHIVRGMVEPSEVIARGHFVDACWLILFSAVLDGLDGTVARLTNTASAFGLHYDSLSDLVAFGVAPAFLMFAKLNQLDQALETSLLSPRVTDAAVALYAICGALRLARFNVQVGNEEKRSFTGMPIPAAAGTVVTTFLVVNRFLGESKLLMRAILILMVVLSYLMVSTIPFPSPKEINLRGRKTFDVLVAITVLVCVILAFRRAPELVAFVGFMGYIIYSVVRVAVMRRRGVRAAAVQQEEARNGL